MTVYKAIAAMREQSAKKIPFTIDFVTYSMQRNESNGVRTIRRARISKRPPAGKNKYGEQMLNILCLDTLDEIQIWQPLLIFYEGHKLTLT